MSKIVLYGHPLSPFARMTHATAEIFELDYEYREMDIKNNEHKEDWFKKINPAQTIPAITDHDGKFRLTESHAIMKYFCYKKGISGSGSLYPADAQIRAQIDEALCRATDSKVTPGP